MAQSAVKQADAIVIQPLHPALGLEIKGLDLLELDEAGCDIINDMWQLGGALLFRNQSAPAQAAKNLAEALATGLGLDPVEAAAALDPDWHMMGAAEETPPVGAVYRCEAAAPALPDLELSSMEAVADALRMADPEYLAEIGPIAEPHVAGGPRHPALHRHWESGEVCAYPPPSGRSPKTGSARLRDKAEALEMVYRHEWAGGDVLAFDTRAVRCRWCASGAAPVLHYSLPCNRPLKAYAPVLPRV